MEQKKHLKHYGVLGMRWGKRKGSKQSRDSRGTAKIKKTRIKQLTNKQLQTANTRMNLEKNFKRNKKKDFSGAKKTIGGILKVIGSIKVVTVVVENAPKAVKLLSSG